MTANLRKLYETLDKAGCRFISVTANSKIPDKDWGSKSSAGYLTVEQAISRLASKAGNVGIRPGSDIFVIDADGEDAIQRFEQEVNQIPRFNLSDTLVTQTPNGRHYWFRAQHPESLKKLIGTSGFGAHFDIFPPNKNSMIIGPGCYVDNSDKPPKKSGPYTILNDAQIIHAPEAIELKCHKPMKLRLRSTPAKQSTSQSSSETASKPTLQACKNNVTRLLHKIIKAVIGERNDTFSNCSAGIGSYVAHWQAEFENMPKKPLDRLLDAIRETFTDEDDEAERAKHLETAERQYQWGLEHPAVVDKKPAESKSPSRFLEVIEEMGFKGRYNLAWNRGELWIPDDEQEGEGVWRPLIDDEQDYLLARVIEEYGWSLAQSLVKRYFSFVYRQKIINPDIEILAGYRNHILRDRPDLSLEKSFSAWIPEDGEYERLAQRKIWLDIATKIMQDPKSIRTSIMLRGPTLVGKSTIVKNLVPPELGGVGNFSVQGELRNILVLLNSHYAVEFDEAMGINKKDAAFLKSIFGDNKKFIRKLHTSEIQEIDYRAGIFGTVNEEAILYDDPAFVGRFWFIDLIRNEDVEPEEYIRKHRKHFLGLAYEAYQAGERSYMIPQHLIPRQIEKAAPSVYRDIALDDQFANLRWRHIPVDFTIVEFAGYMGMAIDFNQFRRKRLQQTLVKCLTSRGFTSHKGFEKRTWWRRPEGSTDLYPLPDKDVKKSNKSERDKIMQMEFNYMNRNPFENSGRGFEVLH